MEAFDIGVMSAFWLTILSTLLCVVYGALNWNKGAGEEKLDVKSWAKEEDVIKAEL